jgi:alpha-1,3-rhamnosyl/mannosyltransferase
MVAVLALRAFRPRATGGGDGAMRQSLRRVAPLNAALLVAARPVPPPRATSATIFVFDASALRIEKQCFPLVTPGVLAEVLPHSNDDLLVHAGMKLAVSMLLENPARRTGLTTLFHEFVSRGLRLFPDVSWLLFAGPGQPWVVEDRRVEIVRDYPANDHLKRRLLADHFLVPAAARRRGADVLLTTGFVPVRKCLPTAMQVFSLQHLDWSNRLGLGRGLYRNWVMKHSWPKADLVITNSKFAANQVLSVFPEFQGRLTQSYEGLQHEQFHDRSSPDEAARLQSQFALQPGYFLWISNFYAYKQAELLIAGYARLGPELRKQRPLVMVGGSWEGRLEQAKEQATRLGVGQDIRFLNWVDDEWLAPLYRQARAFCLASQEETFGRCVIEAMACGVPCLVNDIPIMREVTAGHALLVDFKDPGRVTSSLARLANGGPEIDALRVTGRTRAAEFTFEKLASERINALQQLLAARRAGRKFAVAPTP